MVPVFSRFAIAGIISLALSCAAAAARPDGELEVRVVEAKTQTPLPARIHLKNARGKAVRTRGLGLAPHGDHFYLDGSTTLGLRRGLYTFLIDAGWERRTQFSPRPFEIQRRAQDTKTLEMQRYANLAEEGWFAADLDANRSLKDLGVVLRAEGLTYAPLTTWLFDEKPWRETQRLVPDRKLPAGVGLHVARFATTDGALLLVRSGELINPSDLPNSEPTADQLRDLRAKGYHVVVADISSWRLPIWLAAGVVDAVCVIDRTSGFELVDTKQSKGRAALSRLFPGERGPGRWREAIYFHALNTGLRIPALAGSGSGDTPSPLGTNRVYTYCRREFSIEEWWQSSLDGQTVVTNGPLMRPKVFGEPPGFTFPLDGGSFTASIALNLTTRDRVDYLELIQNGEPAASVRLEDWAKAGGKLPELQFDAPGWFTVRAVTNDTKRYQMALAAPYFVGNEPYISRASCQFFLDWLQAYAELGSDRPDADLTNATRFWQTRLSEANDR